MNQYLVKVSGFISNVTGSAVKRHADKIMHVEQYIARKETLEGLHSAHTGLKLSRNKARGQVAIGGAASAVAGGYGYHKIREKQRKDILAEYDKLYKQASVVAAGKALASVAMKGAGKAIPALGKATASVARTAGRGAWNLGEHISGSKINTYANKAGLKVGDEAYSAFKGAVKSDAGPSAQAKIITDHSGADAKKTLKDLRGLNFKRDSARVGAIVGGAVGVKKYHDYKTDPDNASYQYYE